VSKGTVETIAVGRGRLRGVDGLRGLAALMVLCSHVWQYGAPFNRGTVDTGVFDHVLILLGLGVVLFFALSGFLLYRRFAAAILGLAPTPSVREYARNRALRILPAYWVILLAAGVVFAAAQARTAGGEAYLGRLVHDPLTLVSDALLIQNYRPETMITGLGVAWTLAIELVFYVSLPLLALPLIRLARGRSFRSRLALALVPALSLLLVGAATKTAGFLVPALGSGSGWDADWSSVYVRSFPYHADLFFLGMGAAVLSVLVESGRVSLGSRTSLAFLGLAAAAFAAAGTAKAFELIPHKLWYSTASVAFGLLLVHLIGGGAGRRSIAVTVLESRPFLLAGLISYSLFLWHAPVLNWMSTRGWSFDGRSGMLLNLVLLGGLAALLSTLTYRFVELPAMRLRNRPPAPAEQLQPLGEPSPSRV
jgi:peptidoglycan/LPS O-acetylase OafA/YrhL